MTTRTPPIEHCFKCGEPTGRAGRSDDSIYDNEDNGPYCIDCYRLTDEYQAECEELQ